MLWPMPDIDASVINFHGQQNFTKYKRVVNYKKHIFMFENETNVFPMFWTHGISNNSYWIALTEYLDGVWLIPSS